MSSRPLTMAFVMDPLEHEDVDESTSFALMLEAQGRGHEILYVAPEDLLVFDGRAAARVTPVTLRRDRDEPISWGEPRTAFFDREVDVAFQRVDPPVDSTYITATQILGVCRKTLVLNRPDSVLSYNEKLFALHYREVMPQTTVTRRIGDLRAFMAEMGGEMIVKPLDGKGGEGIFHLVEGERNVSSILEQATAFESRWVMAQRYLPEVRDGDKRILLLEGEPLGAVLRVPSATEVRANFHAGGRAAKAEITQDDQAIIDLIGPQLREDGLFFVGIDVIGGKLTEINVTSPMGIREINAMDDVCLEAQVIERVEKRVAEHQSA
jgi:glutathione synthase